MANQTTSRGATWARRLQLLAFLYLSSLVIVMGSERIYWYWGGVTVDSILGLALAYSLPVAAGLWALALTRGTGLHHVVLAGAVFGFVVEGVLTPIIYADGLLPLFAAMFVGWHGIVAFVGLWYLVRKWLLAGRTTLLGAVTAAIGMAWGLWARAAAATETLEPEEIAGLAAEGIDTSILSPAEFTLYAALVGVIFALAHMALSYVWPQTWTPGKRSTKAVVLVAIGYMSLAVLPVVIWAPAKLAVLVGCSVFLMRKGRRNDLPTIVTQLAGHFPLRRLLALAPLPVVAAFTYQLAASGVVSDDLLVTFYWSMVGAQVVGGAAAYAWAARRSLRSRRWNTATLVASGPAGARQPSMD